MTDDAAPPGSDPAEDPDLAEAPDLAAPSSARTDPASSRDTPAPSSIGAPALGTGAAIGVALAVTLADAAVLSYAFDPERAGRALVLASMGTLYAALAAVALWRLHRRGELRAVMRPLGGDLTLGAVAAAFLYGAAMAGHLALAPRGTPREWWVARVYLQIGSPDEVNMHLVGGFVFIVAALEEITWRGLVMRVLDGPFGPIRAWLLSTALFGVAHLPTLWLLRDPRAGLNPLVIAAGIGCSFIWGYLAQRTRRLPTAIFAHAFFTWAVIEFPIWRPWDGS